MTDLRWATVSALAPLTVILDGTSTPVPAVNISRNPWPVVNQRCLYQTAPGLVAITALMSWNAINQIWVVDDGALSFSGSGGTAGLIAGTGSGGAFLLDWSLQRDGRHATIYANYQNSGAITPGVGGDVPNKNLIQILDSRFVPAQQQGLGSDGTGRVAAHTVFNTGFIALCAVAGKADPVASGEQLSVSGTYRLG